MDSATARIHSFKLLALGITLVVCAWLIPSSEGVAVSSGDGFSVKVTVMDAIGSTVGNSSIGITPQQGLTQKISRFVTRTASSKLAGSTLKDNAQALGANSISGLPLGFGADGNEHDDAVSGGVPLLQLPVSELIITVSQL